MKIIRIARNAVVAKLINPDSRIVNFVNGLLSYQVESVGWTGKSSFYDVLSHSFPAGFVYLVQQELSKLGFDVQVVQKPHAVPLGPENPIVDEFGNDDPRYDYQLKALRQVEKHGAGIIRVATGGGKSKIAKLIMARYRRMSLFVTTRGILLYQMKDQLDDIGLNTGVVGDGTMKFVRGVNLGMVQTLVQALEEPAYDVEVRAIIASFGRSKKDRIPEAEVLKRARENVEHKTRRREAILKFLEMIEVVIGEEAHEAGGDSYYKILKYCKNATIRVALTATPFMRAQAADNMRLMAGFGSILIDVSEQLLIERGILAKPYFKFVNVPSPALLKKSTGFQRAYELGYVENEAMHEAILADARNAASRGMPILTLITRKKHGELLLKKFTDAGLRFVFLSGEDDMDGRKAALKKLINRELDGVIGTTILDVGVDVPALGLVQLAGGMKAQVSLRQRIGRGLRSKKIGANVAFVADYSANLNHHLRDHARTREAIVRATPGFVEGIVPAGQDFDWSLFD